MKKFKIKNYTENYPKAKRAKIGSFFVTFIIHRLL